MRSNLTILSAKLVHATDEGKITWCRSAAESAGYDDPVVVGVGDVFETNFSGFKIRLRHRSSNISRWLELSVKESERGQVLDEIEGTREYLETGGSIEARESGFYRDLKPLLDAVRGSSRFARASTSEKD